jgi:hypothetical protein
MILLFPSLIHLKTDEDKAFFKPRYVMSSCPAQPSCSRIRMVFVSWIGDVTGSVR